MENCLPCPAGWACLTPGMGLYNFNHTRCAAGHYCPSGTSYPTQYACPAGKFTNVDDTIRSADCTPCPARKACHAGTGSLGHMAGLGGKQPYDCQAGHYCPQGTRTVNQFNCPAGKYSNQVGLASADECTVCPAGQYCTAGRTTPNGPCTAGYVPRGGDEGEKSGRRAERRGGERGEKGTCCSQPTVVVCSVRCAWVYDVRGCGMRGCGMLCAVCSVQWCGVRDVMYAVCGGFTYSQRCARILSLPFPPFPSSFLPFPPQVLLPRRYFRAHDPPL